MARMVETLGEALERLLDPGEMTTLTNGLRVAAERFDENAVGCMEDGHKLVWWWIMHPDHNPREVEGRVQLVPYPRSYELLAEQMRLQAHQTRELLTRIENGDDEEDEG